MKTQGTIGRLYRQTLTDKNGNVVTDDAGNPVTAVRIYFTQDAVIKQGQMAFCDDIIEDFLALERLNKLGDDQTAAAIIEDIKLNDAKYNRETLFRVKLGQVKEEVPVGDKL